MACFIVPAAEAVVTTIVAKVLESKEKKAFAELKAKDPTIELPQKNGFARKLKWLNNLLWGGSALLAFEHLWHGEIVPWFPFLTAMNDPGDTAEMLHEMSTVGVTMAILVTAAWLGMVAVSSIIEKKAAKAEKKPEIASAKE